MGAENFVAGAATQAANRRRVAQLIKLLPITLPGRHVRLEPLAASHLDTLTLHGAHAEVWRWMPSLRPDPRESVRVWFDTVAPMMARGEMAAFAIVELACGEATGGDDALRRP
jgi:hypothetical protein